MDGGAAEGSIIHIKCIRPMNNVTHILSKKILKCGLAVALNCSVIEFASKFVKLVKLASLDF